MLLFLIFYNGSVFFYSNLYFKFDFRAFKVYFCQPLIPHLCILTIRRTGTKPRYIIVQNVTVRFYTIRTGI